MRAEAEDDDEQGPSQTSGRMGLPDNTYRLAIGVVTIVGTVVSSNGWVDFRAGERNEVILKSQQAKVEHVEALVAEIRAIHNKRDIEQLDILRKLDTLLARECKK